MTRESLIRCVVCRSTIRPCFCTESDYRAEVEADEAAEAYYRAEEAAKTRKPVVEDWFAEDRSLLTVQREEAEAWASE
jgi:hypothetical protein